MVKNIYLTLDDKDHAKVLKMKGSMTWRQFLLGKADEVAELIKLQKEVDNVQK